MDVTTVESLRHSAPQSTDNADAAPANAGVVSASGREERHAYDPLGLEGPRRAERAPGGGTRVGPWPGPFADLLAGEEDLALLSAAWERGLRHARLRDPQQVDEAVRAVRRTLRANGVDGEMVQRAFLVTPNAFLNGATPLDACADGHVEAAARAAALYGHQIAP